MGEFKTLYKVLEDALKGKRIRTKTLKNTDMWGRYLMQYKKVKASEKTDWAEEEVVGWTKKEECLEWTGTVDKILFNDNSHADIIFDKDKPRTHPEGCYEDCFNWHMGDYIEILD